MPREPKKLDNRGPGETVPRQFRLGDETLAHLDEIAATLPPKRGKPAGRAEAIRVAAKRYVRILRKKQNNSDDSA